jgi:hypothetical protein
MHCRLVAGAGEARKTDPPPESFSERPGWLASPSAHPGKEVRTNKNRIPNNRVKLFWARLLKIKLPLPTAACIRIVIGFAESNI